MKIIANKYPSILRDNLMGADPFNGQPHKKIDINPSIAPHYEQGVWQTPHHIKHEAQPYIKCLLDEKIIELQREVSA